MAAVMQQPCYMGLAQWESDLICFELAQIVSGSGSVPLQKLITMLSPRAQDILADAGMKKITFIKNATKDFEVTKGLKATVHFIGSPQRLSAPQLPAGMVIDTLMADLLPSCTKSDEEIRADVISALVEHIKNSPEDQRSFSQLGSEFPWAGRTLLERRLNLTLMEFIRSEPEVFHAPQKKQIVTLRSSFRSAPRKVSLVPPSPCSSVSTYAPSDAFRRTSFGSISVSPRSSESSVSTPACFVRDLLANTPTHILAAQLVMSAPVAYEE